MLTDNLKSLGLGKNEASVYVSLQELGKSKAGSLIEKTGLHRNLVYQSLKSLQEKGLLTKIASDGATMFQPNDPSELLHLVKRQELTAQQIVEELSSRAKISKQKVSLHEGSTGFRSAFWDMIETLEAGQELLIMGIFDIDEEFQGMIKTFHEERAEAGIPSRILLNAHAKHVGDMLDRIDVTTVRYMQPGMVTPSVFFIYAGKTMISLPNQRTFIRIENEEATKAFRAYFNTLWDRTTQTFRGEEGFQSFLDVVLGAGEPVLMQQSSKTFKDVYPELWEKWQEKNLVTEQVRSDQPHDLWVIGDYVANIIWLEKDSTTVFLMHHEQVAGEHRRYFKDLQERDKKNV